MSFNERLIRTVRERGHLCVGLDPDLNLPFPVAGETDSDRLFFTALETARIALNDAAAFKPNIAFFEAVKNGGDSFERLAGALPGSVLRICDAKRGDIGNTSGKYAEAVFRLLQFDAVTVNPLMGYDCVEPFLRDPEKGVFLLCLTSNPGASDFLLDNDLYLRIAEKAMEWNRNGNVGLVVGATRPEYAARVREIAPDLPFLIPGVGAQGGALDAMLRAINGRNNPGFLINASRGIMYAKDPGGETTAKVIRESAAVLRKQIQDALTGETQD